ncbi:glycosyltransferase family 4 protein [Leifsonia sp. NPDC102414]|uniref:glycosyltransferase family 4 protein n=1 Tax=Leifsonia sp. NPDC102414 TaxID=3364124 RepID=UPI0038066BF0
MTARRPRIVLGVTVDLSLRLMAGFPQFLAERGWDVHVVCSPGTRLDALNGVDGVTVHPLTMAREPSPLSDLRSLIAWVRLLRRLRPDVISVGTPKAGLLGGIAGRLTKVPGRVYMLRGLRLETSTGASRRIFTFLERLTIRSATKTLAVSASLASRAVELKLASPDAITVLGDGSSNGIDVDAFERSLPSPETLDRLRAELVLSTETPVVGFVGRLTEDKGLLVLSAAVERLANQGTAFQLLIVGGVEGDASVADLIPPSPGITTVTTGFVNDPERYYPLMDVLCLPTLREGFPNVVLEAAAAGVPTVTTTATGAVDSVVDGQTGIVVPVGDAEALADGLRRVIADQALRQRFGAAAKLRARERFDRSVVWAAQERFYLTLIGARQ